jgi:AraC family transcriptional regulator
MTSERTRSGYPGAAGLGVRVTQEVVPAGPVALAAARDHRVRIHAGAPVAGSCRAEAFLYQRGDIDVVPAGEDDRWEQDEAATVVLLSLAPELLARAALDLGFDAQREPLRPRHQVRDARIEHIAWALEAERVEGFPSGTLFAESLALGLAVQLLSRSLPARDTARALSPRQLARLSEYIDAHIDRDLSLGRLAQVAGLSATHLKALFRRSTGVPVHAFVVQRRVERARALLARGELPIAQVALEAGFAHQSHMARWMKRLLGVAPSSLRRAR